MFTIREYAMPETLDEAYTILKSRKGNQILGGCAWLRLGKKRINIAVDLTKYGDSGRFCLRPFWFFGFSDTAFDVGYICCTLQERKHSAGDIYDDAL